MLASSELKDLRARVGGRGRAPSFGPGRPDATERVVDPGTLYGGSSLRYMTASTPLDALKAPTVFTVIDRRANIIQSLNWRVGHDSSWTGQDIVTDVQSGHWLVKLLKKPNPWMVRSSMFRLISKWLDVNGNAYLYTPIYDGELVPKEMWLLPSNRIQVVPGRERLIDGYVYYANGQRYGIDADDVLHLKTLQPSEDTRHSVYLGQSLVLFATGAAMMEVEMQDFANRHLKNDALPAFALLSPKTYNTAQFATFKENWNQTFRGAGGAGKWALLDNGMQIQTFSTPSRLKDLADLSPSVRESICMVLGYPAAALTWQGLNRATAQEMRDDVLDVITKPHATYIAEEMSQHFSKYEMDLVVEPIFPAPQNVALTPQSASVVSGIRTKATVRDVSDSPQEDD